MKKTILLLCLLAPIVLFSQTTMDSTKLLKVFLSNVSNEDYLKSKIVFVNFVRDRNIAQVVLIETRQTTGSSGTLFNYIFIGQESFSGKNDTLQFTSNVNSTADEIEKSEVQTISLGLIQYVSHTPASSALVVKYIDPVINQSDDEEKDKWHHWLYSIGVYGNASGEKSNTSLYLSGSVSADHVTNEWKINLAANYSYSYDSYTYSGYSFINKQYSKSFSALAVKSLSDHWSAGLSSDIYHSQYSNFQVSENICPTLEYDVFKYDASATHLLTFKLRAEPTYNHYIDTTIYNQTEEFIMGSTMSARFSLKEKWGSISSNVSGSVILDDPDKHNLSLSGNMSWNILQGLSMSLFGSLNIIHDQINLPKQGASQEELLLQLHELQTNFRYYGYLSLSYSFGSIFNNIVNPRFESSSNYYY